MKCSGGACAYGAAPRVVRPPRRCARVSVRTFRCAASLTDAAREQTADDAASRYAAPHYVAAGALQSDGAKNG